MAKIINHRSVEFDVNPIFPSRWSPRAMSGETISDNELFTLFEAARWAPSSNNEQPWRFIYAKRGTEHWNRLFNILNERNRAWCKNAAVLICLITKKDFTDRELFNRNFLSDAGAAWENFALQGSLKGLVVHGIAGYDIEKARKDLEIPSDYEVVHMIAVGKPGKKENLPPALQEREQPSDRKPVQSFIFEGKFK